MRKFRIVGAATSLAVLVGAAVAAGGPVSAATSGVGTTRTTTTGANISLGNDGSLLSVQVLGDDGSANIDPKQGTPSSAASSLSPLNASSQTLPASTVNQVLPKVSVSSTGAADNKSVPTISLNTPISTGTIAPLSLSSAVDAATGAASGLTSSVNNLTAVGGLLSIPSLQSSLGANAKPGDSDALRGITTKDANGVDQPIKVLNLGAVLQGLGVNPASLTAGQVGSVLTALNTTITSSIGTLNGADVTNLAGLQDVLTTLPPGGVSGLPLNTVITGLPAPVQNAILQALGLASLPAGISTVGDLQTLLTTTFTNAVNTIGGATLLQVDSLNLGVNTKALDTVQNSVAAITAAIGTVHVGNVPITGADLTSIATTAQSTVNSVLTAAGLPTGILTLKLLDQSKSVGSQAGYVNSLANLTAVHVALAPLSSLAGGATSQAATDTMSQILGSANVPVLSTAMATLNTALNTTNALGTGATVDVLQVGAASTFTPSSASTNPPAATPQSGTLATTGGPTQILGFVGLLLLATVAGLRWLRRPATTN
jgi:hypothetical protein